MNEVTQLLDAVGRGEAHAAEPLLPLVYEELRRLAAGYLDQEKAGQTLQPTALVHEAYLRLVGGDVDAHWQGRAHFLATASLAMRHLLIDSARRKRRDKRGGDRQRVDLADVVDAGQAEAERLIAIVAIADVQAGRAIDQRASGVSRGSEAPATEAINQPLAQTGSPRTMLALLLAGCGALSLMVGAGLSIWLLVVSSQIRQSRFQEFAVFAGALLVHGLIYSAAAYLVHRQRGRVFGFFALRRDHHVRGRKSTCEVGLARLRKTAVENRLARHPAAGTRRQS